MSDELVYMMGQYTARFPTDRLYAKNHMWALPSADGYRFGFSAYAIRLLQDVYFLDWTIDANTPVRARQEIGAIESSKAESALYAPIAGLLSEFNQSVLGDPALINVDPYGRGWLFALAGDSAELLSPADYMVHLEAAWKIAERTIKGQMNETD